MSWIEILHKIQTEFETQCIVLSKLVGEPEASGTDASDTVRLPSNLEFMDGLYDSIATQVDDMKLCESTSTRSPLRSVDSRETVYESSFLVDKADEWIFVPHSNQMTSVELHSKTKTL